MPLSGLFLRRKSVYMEKKRTAALHNLGCKVNEYETERMKRALAEAGYEIVPFTEEADVYVINTCTVTAVADQKSRQMLHRARRLNPNAVVVAAGCFVQTAVAKDGAEKVLADTGADILLGNNEKTALSEKIEDFLSGRKAASDVIDINERGISFEEMGAPSEDSKTLNRTSGFLKIQDGCDRFCSYCLIPYARGRSRSRTTADIVKEARTLAERGLKETVVTGIHIGSFKGADDGASLIDLLEQLCDLPGIERVRLGSLEPVTVTEDFAKRLSVKEEICPQFHMSLQSGSDTVLARMNRHYTTEEFASSVAFLRKYFDKPAITTDIICGFPGETEEEFEETLAFARKIGFYEIHVFPFSSREGTRAAALPGQLPKAVKAERVNRLIEQQKPYKKAYMESFVGKPVSVLTEERETIGGKHFVTGYSKEYLRVAIPMEDLNEYVKNAEPGQELIGLTVPVQIQDSLDDDVLLGMPVFL